MEERLWKITHNRFVNASDLVMTHVKCSQCFPSGNDGCDRAVGIYSLWHPLGKLWCLWNYYILRDYITEQRNSLRKNTAITRFFKWMHVKAGSLLRPSLETGLFTVTSELGKKVVGRCFFSHLKKKCYSGGGWCPPKPLKARSCMTFNSNCLSPFLVHDKPKVWLVPLQKATNQ